MREGGVKRGAGGGGFLRRMRECVQPLLPVKHESSQLTDNMQKMGQSGTGREKWNGSRKLCTTSPKATLRPLKELGYLI